jgi:hypothetical protein
MMFFYIKKLQVGFLKSAKSSIVMDTCSFHKAQWLSDD